MYVLERFEWDNIYKHLNIVISNYREEAAIFLMTVYIKFFCKLIFL